MIRVLVTGASGQLGQEMQLSKPIQGVHFVFCDKVELNVLSPISIERSFKEVQPTHVINLASFTDVDEAETHENDAYELNSIGAKNIAKACKKHDAILIHFSTAYVFGNDKRETHSPEDSIQPLNVFGLTKSQGEIEIIKSNCKHIILRTSWIYSNLSENFYLKMLLRTQRESEINVVEDQFSSPTSTKELCRAIDAILKTENPEVGIYHFAGVGKTSYKEWALEILKQAKIPGIIKGVLTLEWSSKPKRPHNCYLSSQKFMETFGYFPMHWKNALTEIISEKKISPIKVGYTTTLFDQPYIVVSVDWSKEECVLAEVGNLKNFINLNFKDLYE